MLKTKLLPSTLSHNFTRTKIISICDCVAKKGLMARPKDVKNRHFGMPTKPAGLSAAAAVERARLVREIEEAQECSKWFA